ncbi:MAG: Na+/H+ antiporter NhaA [Desulfococcaceae bacterium]|nr:Na+/H+ antiporter NhaA [Desulfococcaceae bacterium]
MKQSETSKIYGPPRTHGMHQIRAENSTVNRQVMLPAEKFIHNETISGALLIVCAITALIWANSPWSRSYFALCDLPLTIQIGTYAIAMNLQHWINDGLMSVFFFVVALEIKRELIHGDLSEARRAALPVAAALGGMILPAGLYLILNAGGKGVAGWGIPMATDIAFTIAILALLGSRVPPYLRMFLLTFAITDDVGSILVIAINYTAHFSAPAMGVAAAVLGLILMMHRLGFRLALSYALPAVIFWVAILKSGVHPTIAGVILGAVTPAKSPGCRSTFIETVQFTLPNVCESMDSEESERSEVLLGRIEELARQTESPLARLERTVHPWVSFLILPVFALMNAGVAVSGEFIRQAFASPVTLGVMLGLIVGKMVGVTAFAWLAVRLGWAVLPRGVAWRHIMGTGLIGGVGFTVALFITGLAFTDKVMAEEAKIGVISASLIAAIGGYLFLLLAGHGQKNPDK